jgi:hypothetical protein
MEEFRPVLADRCALTLLNRRQISPKDFRVQESGAVELTEEARKLVLTTWQERKRDELRTRFWRRSSCRPVAVPPGGFSPLLAQRSGHLSCFSLEIATQCSSLLPTMSQHPRMAANADFAVSRRSVLTMGSECKIPFLSARSIRLNWLS